MREEDLLEMMKKLESIESPTKLIVPQALIDQYGIEALEEVMGDKITMLEDKSNRGQEK